jgi:hypothetical protein
MTTTLSAAAKKRIQTYFSCGVLILACAAVVYALFQPDGRSARFTLAMLLVGLLGMSLSIVTALRPDANAWLGKHVPFGLAISLAAACLGSGIYWAWLARHATDGIDVNTHIIAILTNIVPSASAGIAIASKYDVDLRLRKKRKS